MTYSIVVFDKKGKKKKEHNLVSVIFSDDNINESIMHEYVVMYLANQRQSTAHTKTRGEIRRSGRKLYRQKGTGRARVGDAGSPIRRKGGVVFGPRNEKVWNKSMPKKMKRKALYGSLTLKAKGEDLVGLDSFDISSPKTKEAVDVLASLNVQGAKTLVVVHEDGDATIKSLRNIQGVKTVAVNMLNAYDVLSHKKVVFTRSALQNLESQFTS